MTIDAYLKELRERVSRVQRLLDNPEPGLSTWHMMLGQAMDALMSFWREDPRLRVQAKP